MFEKEAKKWVRENTHIEHSASFGEIKVYPSAENGFQKGAEFSYNKANEWFDATKVIPVPKTLEIYRYTTEAISDKGDIVCYDYKDKCWKKIVIEDEKVTYVPVEVEMWCNTPTKESE